MGREITLISTAYILTGIYKIVREYRLPYYDQPAYIRRSTYKMIFLMIFGWILADINFVLFDGYWRDGYMRGQALLNLTTFGMLVTLGYLFLL